METLLVFAGPVVTLIGAMLALLLDKDGKWTRPAGRRRLFLLTIMAGFVLAVWQSWATLRKAADARAEAEAAENREAAGQRTMLGGFDFNRPFETGSFYFDVGTGADGAPNRFDGFVGPFPALGPDASGTLKINVRDGFYYEVRLEPGPGASLRLVNADGRGAPYVLRASASRTEFAPDGAPAGWREQSRWSEEPLRSGQWAATGEGTEFAYHLGVASPEPLRRIVSGLAGANAYGSLTLHLPGVPEARKAAIADAYRRIKPYFVFYAPFASGTLNAEHCVSRIRVPMEMRRVESAAENDLVLKISATREGFTTETCDTAYIP